MAFQATTRRSGGVVQILNDSDVRLLKTLQHFEPKLQRKAVRKALRTGSKVVQKKARELAPVRTGLLKKQIKVKAMKRKKGRVGVNVVLAAKAKGDEQFYAPFVELGTRHIKARGFLKQAFKEMADVADGNIRAELAKQVAAMTPF